MPDPFVPDPFVPDPNAEVIKKEDIKPKVKNKIPKADELVQGLPTNMADIIYNICGQSKLADAQQKPYWDMCSDILKQSPKIQEFIEGKNLKIDQHLTQEIAVFNLAYSIAGAITADFSKYSQIYPKQDTVQAFKNNNQTEINEIEKLLFDLIGRTCPALQPGQIQQAKDNLNEILDPLKFFQQQKQQFMVGGLHR